MPTAFSTEEDMLLRIAGLVYVSDADRVAASACSRGWDQTRELAAYLGRIVEGANS
jgi:hypothetical protein